MTINMIPKQRLQPYLYTDPVMEFKYPYMGFIRGGISAKISCEVGAFSWGALLEGEDLIEDSWYDIMFSKSFSI